MKRSLASFFNSPALVALVSLVIAGCVAYATRDDGAEANARAYAALASRAENIVADPTGAHLTVGFTGSGRVESVKAIVGATVRTGDVLATLDQGSTAGALTQANAAYVAARANYDKVLNGATGPAIDAAKATVHSAEVALAETKRTESLLVSQAYTALLNVTPEAYPKDIQDLDQVAPTISGSYTKGVEGDIVVTTFASGAESGLSMRLSGLASGTAVVSFVTPQPLGDTGLSILFPEGARAGKTWVISVPNAKASAYTTKLAAYEAAKQTERETVASAEAALAEAESNLAVVAAKARPEDVAAAQAAVDSARGALLIAESAADSRVLKAPIDGTVSAVYVQEGETISADAPAFELTRTTTEQ